jgi:hypothetical protein
MDDEVAVEVLDREGAVVVRRPAALDLYPADVVALGVEGKHVVTREVRVRLRRLDALYEEVGQDKELGPSDSSLLSRRRLPAVAATARVRRLRVPASAALGGVRKLVRSPVVRAAV